MSIPNPPNPPTLADLLALFGNAVGPSATFPWGESLDVIHLTWSFKKEDLGEALWVYAGKWPSMIIPALVSHLKLSGEMLGVSTKLEDAFRTNQPVKSIDDAIAFLQQELSQDVHSIGTLYTKMRRDFLNATITYMMELGRRRREADERLRETEILRKQRAREKTDREAEALRRAENERAKAEAHARWQRAEEDKARHNRKKTSDSGFNPSSQEEAFWKAFRDAGGFENFGGGGFREFNWEFNWGNSGPKGRSPPPPPPSSSGGKRRWFEVLGVQPNASKDEIKKAARKLASQFHPDKHRDDPAMSRKMQEVNNARDEGLDGL
jgi:hypothetical protein